MARYEGSKSFYKLLTGEYGRSESNTRSFNLNDIFNKPLSFIPTGNYSGGLYRSNNYGGYRIKTIITNYTFYFNFFSSYFDIHRRQSLKEDFGLSFRCVAKLATDSICPKGWEMARVSGKRSYYELVINIYSMKTSVWLNSGWQPHSGVNNIDAPVIISPASFIRAGNYIGNAARSDRSASGNYWISSAIGDTNARSLNFYSTVLYTASNNYVKRMGFSVRCVAKLPLLSFGKARRKIPTLLILFVPKGGRWQDLVEMEAIKNYLWICMGSI